jgi:integrase
MQVDKKLTSHTARHSFGTTVTLSNGVPIESVKEMMGHTNIKQTLHYARVLPIKLSEDMQLLKLKLGNFKFLNGIASKEQKADGIKEQKTT